MNFWFIFFSNRWALVWMQEQRKTWVSNTETKIKISDENEWWLHLFLILICGKTERKLRDICDVFEFTWTSIWQKSFCQMKNHKLTDDFAKNLKNSFDIRWLTSQRGWAKAGNSPGTLLQCLHHNHCPCWGKPSFLVCCVSKMFGNSFLSNLEKWNHFN